MGYDKDKFMETQKVPRKLKKKLKGVSGKAGVPVVNSVVDESAAKNLA